MSKNYTAMEHGELSALKESKSRLLHDTEREIKSLKKMFKSGRYDRQVICENLLSYQRQRDTLIASIEWISRILEGKLAAA